MATSIAYVSLATLTRELDASARDLLWIVDGFNLTFAAVVAAGSRSDRFGRKGALVRPEPVNQRPVVVRRALVIGQ